MKVTTELTEDRVANLTIEVTDDEVRPALEKAARQVSNRFAIPGFRKGHAPFAVVQRMVGEEYLLREALEQMAPDLVERAIKEQELEPGDRPELVDVQIKPMRLVVSVPLEPEVVLGDYRAIHIEAPSVEVTDEDVAKALEQLRRRRMVREPVERPAELGDLVTGYLRITVDGEERTADDFEVELAEDRDLFPGMRQALIGKRVGDTVEFETTLPDDFADEELAGKRAVVRAEIRKVEEGILPELNDEFAVLVGDYDNLEALKAETRERLEKEAKDRALSELRRKAIEALVASATIKIPRAVIESEAERLVEEFKREAQERRISLEALLKSEGVSEEEFRKRQLPLAERRLRESLALRAFVKAEGIEVSDEELRARADMTAGRLAGDARALAYVRSPEFRLSIASNLLYSRAMRRLISIVTGEPEEPEPEIPPEAMPAPPVEVVEASEAEDEPGGEKES